ncbi:MAG: glutathione S-transferase family protein [Betaproteobacteria bacterium]|nr:glutathione S-transferase family protein [Betaproteobacteria bacterium]
MKESPLEPILHHYDISPYAEKIRLALGHKRIAWRSVIQPMVLPKPDLVCLTGGYRRIPVLQIGADVFCDTNLIALVLERLQPSPTLYPDGKRAETDLWCSWAERVLMWPTARYVTGVNDDKLGAAFHADRAAMRGHAAPSPEVVAAAVPYNREQCRIMLQWLDAVLADGRACLLGSAPGVADFAVYQRICWLHAFGGRATDVLEGLPALFAWAARVKAIGHGRRSELDASDAHRIARAAVPDPALRPGTPVASPPIGARISIGTEGHAPDAVTGAVVSSTSEAISVAHESDAAGKLVVHFPRLGYEWRAA